MWAQANEKSRSPKRNLDAAIREAMVGRQGTVVVLDVASDKLLAAYRPALAARRRAAPGSVVKPFTLLTLIDNGVIQPQSRWMCTRTLAIAGRRLDCTHPPISDPLDSVEALAYSCNQFFAHYGGLLTSGQLAQGFSRAGLASRPGLFKDEVAGVVEPAADEETRKLQAIGESNIEVTAAGLAEAYRKLLLRRNEPELAPVFRGMEEATEYGTAYRAAPNGVKVAGKTGTGSGTGGSWTHAWFAGYAPADDPKIVVVVFVERGHGGSDAALVAGRVFSAWAEGAK